MIQDNRTRLKDWLTSGEARIQPLTYPQRELWEASALPAADVTNNICAIIQIRGALTPQGSETAMQKVVDRQEAFRLSFLPGKDRPMQLIRNSSIPAIQFHQLSPPQRSDEAMEEIARDLFQQPFDLVQGPLYRAKVFRRSADDHVLVLAIHHSIADGWTLGVFVQDLFAAYLLGKRGSNAALPPVSMSYSAWGVAERAFWQPAELARRATFWKEHLSGVSRQWGHVAAGAMQRQVTHVSAMLGRSIRELAKCNGTTLFTTLLTAFQVTISKWTGCNDVVVGTPVANRNKQAMRETAGYCSGIVPLRGQVDHSRSFVEMLRQVHEDTIESFANAMPFVELVKALGKPATASCNPIFDIRFALQNHPVPDVSVGGLSLQLRMRSTGTARFDLACEINEQGDALEVAWLFHDGQFASDDILQLSQRYLSALKVVCHSPDVLSSTFKAALP